MKPFIVIEGGDCCGKSTTATMILDRLVERGIPYKTFHPFYDHDVGMEAYKAMCNREPIEEVQAKVINAHFVATRTMATPAIEEGKVVIQDRNFISSIVYQWLNHGYDLDDCAELIESIKECYKDCKPFVILLDGTDSVIDQRIANKKDKDANELEAVEFHQNIRRHYRELFAIWKQLGFEGVILNTDSLEPFTEELDELLRSVIL